MSQAKPNIWIYPCLFSAASVGAVLFSPLLPSIQKQFSLGSDAVQLLLSLYLVGFAVSQILYTLPAKRFGKKKMILLALSLGLLGNLIVTLGAYKGLFSVILLGRVLCALGAGGTLGLAMGLILDFHTPKEGAFIISLGVTSFGVFPSIGTVCAGFLVPFSWIWPLHLLSLYFLFLICFASRIPNVEFKAERASFKKFLLGVGAHLIGKKFLAYTCTWGFNTASLYLFVTYASLIAVNLWGMGIRTFSLILSCVPFGMLGGLALNHTFAGRVGRERMLRRGLLMEVIFLLVVCFSFQLEGVMRVLLFFGGTFGVYVCTPVVSANASSLGLEHSPDRSVGSALMGCLNLMITTGVLFSVRAYPVDGELIFDKAFLILALILAVLLLLYKRAFHLAQAAG